MIEQGLPDALWVRVEISEPGGKNGNPFLTLTERNERGDPRARVKGVIFRRKPPRSPRELYREFW